MAEFGNRGGGRKTPTTAPPPFDPAQFAQDSEVALRVARPPDSRSTVKLPSAPPLNKRVRLNVPLSDLAWFDLDEAALAFAARVDGQHTLHELLEGGDAGELLGAIAKLQDAGVLDYES